MPYENQHCAVLKYTSSKTLVLIYWMTCSFTSHSKRLWYL